ncbi:MAG: carboxymuconolactone decarboxylase family protein [Methyloligellaceae bacterium]
MPRVSEVDETELPDDLAALHRKFSGPYGDFTNQLRVLAHSPDAFRHLYGLIDDWRTRGTLPQRIVEIAVVTTSEANACPYCIGHHGTALVELGLSADTVTHILEPEPPGFDDRDLAVRDYARLLTERAWGIPDAVFERLRRHFADREIVELTVRIGICSLFNKLNQALQIEMEDAVLARMADAGLTVTKPPDERAGSTRDMGKAQTVPKL